MKLVTTKSAAASKSSADPNAPWNVYHRGSSRSAQHMMFFAALAGMELQAQKDEMDHGEWIPWIEAHCEYSRRTASGYIATAEKAMKALGTTDLAAAKDRINELIAAKDSEEQCQALLNGIRPPKAEPAAKPEPKPTKPAKPRPTGPRPLFASPKALPKAIARWQATPPAARNQFLDSIRDEALAHYQAA